MKSAAITLARGDRRDYVIIDRKGGMHSLARRIDGMKAAELREFMAAMNPESVPNIEQAREIIAERERRARELKESREEARIEAGYSHGDDYVSQTRAALRDHERRQRAAQEVTGSDKAEMSDARRRRLDRLAAASKANERARDHSEDDPDRQKRGSRWRPHPEPIRAAWATCRSITRRIALKAYVALRRAIALLLFAKIANSVTRSNADDGRDEPASPRRRGPKKPNAPPVAL